MERSCLQRASLCPLCYFRLMFNLSQVNKYNPSIDRGHMPCLGSLVWLCLASPAYPSERKRGQCAPDLNGNVLAFCLWQSLSRTKPGTASLASRRYSKHTHKSPRLTITPAVRFASRLDGGRVAQCMPVCQGIRPTQTHPFSLGKERFEK